MPNTKYLCPECGKDLQICGKEIVTVRTSLKNKVQLKKSLKILK